MGSAQGSRDYRADGASLPRALDETPAVPINSRIWGTQEPQSRPASQAWAMLLTVHAPRRTSSRMVRLETPLHRQTIMTRGPWL